MLRFFFFLMHLVFVEGKGGLCLNSLKVLPLSLANCLSPEMVDELARVGFLGNFLIKRSAGEMESFAASSNRATRARSSEKQVEQKMRSGWYLYSFF